MHIYVILSYAMLCIGYSITVSTILALLALLPGGVVLYISGNTKFGTISIIIGTVIWIGICALLTTWAKFTIDNYTEEQRIKKARATVKTPLNEKVSVITIPYIAPSLETV